MSGITYLVGGTGAGVGGETGVGAFSCDSKDATEPPNPVGATGSGCMSGIRVTTHGVFSDADAATSLHASEDLSCSRRDLTASGSWRPLGSACGVLRKVTLVRVTLIFIPVLVSLLRSICKRRLEVWFYGWRETATQIGNYQKKARLICKFEFGSNMYMSD